MELVVGVVGILLVIGVVIFYFLHFYITLYKNKDYKMLIGWLIFSIVYFTSGALGFWALYFILLLGMRIYCIQYCYCRAKELNKSPYCWAYAFYGCLFGVIAVIGLYDSKPDPVITPLTEEQKRAQEARINKIWGRSSEKCKVNSSVPKVKKEEPVKIYQKPKKSFDDFEERMKYK